MAAQVGMRVRNKDRILQIDGEYQNHELVLVADYNLTGTAGGLGGPTADVSVPAGRTNAIIAVAKADRGVYVKKIDASTFRIFAGNNQAGSSGTVRVYMFAVPIERTSTGLVGLVIRSRLTGAVVYNSNYKYLKILKFFTVDLYMPQDANVPPSSVSYDFPGKSVAIIQCLRPYGRRQVAGGTPQQPNSVFGFFSGTMRTPVPTTATIEHRVTASAVGPPGSSVTSMTLGAYIVVDVTSYG